MYFLTFFKFLNILYSFSATLSTIRALKTSEQMCTPTQPSPLRLTGAFSTCSESVKEGLNQRHPDQTRDTSQLLQKYGYPFQTYNVITKDSYILTVYRITGSPKSTRKSHSGGKQSVYLNHGFGGASNTWNFQPKSRNLPFKLADAGYDVWLANGRGTTYSLKHTNTRYTANRDTGYWNFSFHEMGIYDVPAVTNKILSETNSRKIFYIGHSMGTTQYFIALSELPEMNDKIAAGFLLAPTAYMGHVKRESPLRLLAPLLANHPQHRPTNTSMSGKFENIHHLRQYLKRSPNEICDPTAKKCGICDNVMFLLFGYDAWQMNATELPNILAKYPNNIPMKCLAHYSQNIVSCKFQKYDYGEDGNIKEYGSQKAPEYNLRNIRAPTYFFYGEQDTLAPPNDVQITASKMQNGVLKGNYKVKNKFFNHVDFILAKDANKLVYNKILSEMKKFRRN
ncbi:unnamed protein product [Orchesella dallaii]|uniref:Partial AB-hydrolase lipase domain-containing protein n=1 Tax=Orchesella dallaii TaxID=48710 RepID=A0ABP1RS55_9HEXA